MPAFAPSGRFPPMAAVYKAAVRRRLPLDEIRQEIERQLARFVDHYGAPPAHIDGHHHVHQLPGVRDIVIEIARRVGKGDTWVRCTADSPVRVLQRGVAATKSIAIGALGGGIRRRARTAGVPTNHGFSGAYDFRSEQRPMGELFRRFVTAAGDNMLIMCHPGYADAMLQGLDSMTAARDLELTYLKSPDWPALMAEQGLKLGPLRR